MYCSSYTPTPLSQTSSLLTCHIVGRLGKNGESRKLTHARRENLRRGKAKEWWPLPDSSVFFLASPSLSLFLPFVFLSFSLLCLFILAQRLAPRAETEKEEGSIRVISSRKGGNSGGTFFEKIGRRTFSAAGVEGGENIFFRRGSHFVPSHENLPFSSSLRPFLGD